MKKLLFLFIIFAISAVWYGISTDKKELQEAVNQQSVEKTGEVVSIEQPDTPTKMKVDFILNEEFVKNYEYEHSRNYCFAVNIVYN